ncbi:hypothetical protein QBK99_15140 [Corticibacterium sp. UT-5YL-CI-8]|nr:hypothetical protein [Tianweitania sp. UT-5YL-CI-8]
MERRSLLKLATGLIAASVCAPGARAQKGAIVAAGGQRLGMNLAPVTYWSTEHPFSNLALSASPWRLQEINGPFRWDLELPPSTADGYPLLVPAGHLLETFLIFTPRREHLPDTLTVTYEGRGLIEYVAGGELVSREPGRDIIRILPTNGAVIARLMSTSTDTPLRDVRVLDGEGDASERFRPAFLDRLSSMSVLRFMDWMDTNNSKVSKWEQRPAADRYSQAEGGVAIEIMVELCNRLAIAPWFTLPHLADDDYVRRFAELVKGSLRPELPVYVEYSNEVWNWLFEQSQYAGREGMRLGLSGNVYEAGLRFYSQRSSEVMAIWEDVFGADRERVIGVYAAHGVNAWSSEVVLSWKDAMKHADLLAIAPYFGGGMGNRDNAPTVAQWSLDKLFEALEAEVDGENRDVIQRQAELAKRLGVPLVAYEGGQHLVGNSGTAADETLHRLFAEANRDPRMGELYRRHMDHWRDAGGGIYALFHSMSQNSQWGCWGLMEYESDLNAPKWHAVRQMLNA